MYLNTKLFRRLELNGSITIIKHLKLIYLTIIYLFANDLFGTNKKWINVDFKNITNKIKYRFM